MPLMRPAADDKGMALLIPLVAQGPYIPIYLNFKGRRDYSTRAFPGQVIQRFVHFRSLPFCVICDRLMYGVSFLRP